MRDKLVLGHSGGTTRDGKALQRRSYFARSLETGGGDGMDLPAVGEHVFAVEGIEKKRIRKVKLPQTRTNVPLMVRGMYLLFLYPTRFRRFSGQNRVSGEVARMVSQVSVYMPYF